METRRDERINKLVQSLKQIDRLHLREAARLLGVSEMTIRRDLSEQPSCIMLLGGYIVQDLKSNPGHYFVGEQVLHNVAQKQQLATLAAATISAEDTVFFDCGTTMPWLIDAIDPELHFTAICCAMNTFLALKEKKHCRVILSGGEFHADNAIFTPVAHDRVLDAICPDIAFISAAGIDVTQGATCYNLNELPMKHHALQRARQRVLVADSSKFNLVLPARIGALTLFDRLISDSAPPPALAQALLAADVTLNLPASARAG